MQPGRSYHSVEEVVIDEGRRRFSVSGWFHRPVEGEEGYAPIDKEKEQKQLSSLAQIVSLLFQILLSVSYSRYRQPLLQCPSPLITPLLLPASSPPTLPSFPTTYLHPTSLLPLLSDFLGNSLKPPRLSCTISFSPNLRRNSKQRLKVLTKRTKLLMKAFFLLRSSVKVTGGSSKVLPLNTDTSISPLLPPPLL